MFINAINGCSTVEAYSFQIAFLASLTERWSSNPILEIYICTLDKSFGFVEFPYLIALKSYSSKVLMATFRVEVLLEELRVNYAQKDQLLPVDR
jgi:hypothetical protein